MENFANYNPNSIPSLKYYLLYLLNYDTTNYKTIIRISIKLINLDPLSSLPFQVLLHSYYKKQYQDTIKILLLFLDKIMYNDKCISIWTQFREWLSFIKSNDQNMFDISSHIPFWWKKIYFNKLNPKHNNEDLFKCIYDCSKLLP